MTLLANAAGIKPVAAAADGDEAVALCARHRPDVVLMDLRMPKLDGVEATRRIRAAQPATEIVVLTTHADDQSILDALQAGARGYLTKDAGIAEISRAIQAAADHQALPRSDRPESPDRGRWRRRGSEGAGDESAR